MTRASYLRSLARLGRESPPAVSPPHIPKWGLRQLAAEPEAATAVPVRREASPPPTPAPTAPLFERDEPAAHLPPPVSVARPRRDFLDLPKPAPKPAPKSAQAEAKRTAPAVEAAMLTPETPALRHDPPGKQPPGTPASRLEPIAPAEPAAPSPIPAAPASATPQWLSPAIAPPPSPPKMPSAAESPAGNRIHIGAIDVHISPPPQKRVPKPASPLTPPPAPALARGFFSPFGLRQG